MTGNSEPAFIDTNVLLYAHDRLSPRKSAVARNLIQEIWARKNGILSVQVLQEFYVDLIQKIPCPIPASEAEAVVREYLNWQVIPQNGAAVLEAIDIHRRNRISFWDALIVEGAKQSRAETIYTEDLSDGQVIEGVRIVNPFKSGD
jgi:predicted nucleic acid-binding protein